MINDTRTTIAGNVCRPPQLRYRGSDGKPFAVVPVAVNVRRFDKGVQRWVEADTTFYEITCDGTTGAHALACLEVGTPVVAHGTLSVREWEHGTVKGVTLRLRADSVGIDLTWGTARFQKGIKGYPVDDEGQPVAAGPVSAGPGEVPAPDLDASDAADHPEEPDGLEVTDEETMADADGVVDDETAERLLARSA